MENPNIDISPHEEQFFNFDTRTSLEKSHQEKLIECLSLKNRQLFSTEIPRQKSPKPKIQTSLPHIIRTMRFPNNWYVKYTDNIDSHSHFLYKTPVLTIHGCPGYYHDWLGLEHYIGPNQFRIINFFVPGFDNNREDDRGDYSSSLEDLSLLIVKLLDHLAIKRVIFFLHSMGGYLHFYFCQRFPEKVAGLVYLAAPSINWYCGFVVFYGIMVALSKMNRFIGEGVLLKHAKFRGKLVEHLRKHVKNINLEGVQFPNLGESEVCAFVKLMGSLKNISNLYSFSKNMPKVLKFLCCGKNDPINEFEKFVECFYYHVYGDGKIDEKRTFDEFTIGEIKRKLKGIEEFEKINLNYENLQENFVFTFDKTGHNVHKKRCKQIAKPLRCYVAIIDTLEEIRDKNRRVNAKL